MWLEYKEDLWQIQKFKNRATMLSTLKMNVKLHYIISEHCTICKAIREISNAANYLLSMSSQ